MNTTETSTPEVTSEEAAIRQTVMAVEESWNRHNMADFGRLLSADAEWVNPVGMWWRGQTNVQRAHQVYHDTIFQATSRHCESLTIQQVTPAVAIATGTYRTGDWTRPDTGQVVSNGRDRVTYVLVKQQERWLIVRGQVTEIDPHAAAFDPVNQ